MAQYIARNLCNVCRHNLIEKSSYPKTFTNNFGMPNTINSLQLPCVPENNSRNASSNSEMLRTLRLAVMPSFGQQYNTYDTAKTSTASSGLAGDPKRLRRCYDIRAEVLEKWNYRVHRPKVEMQSWLDNLLNTIARTA